MIYDTLKLSRALRTSFTAEQADTLATASSESTEDTVATKADILVLKADIANLRSEMKTGIATLKTDVVRWIMTAIAFNFLGTVGLMVIVATLAAR